MSVPGSLIVITGLPCSGKSTLAARLRGHLQWPLLAKDPIKETLFDSLGWHDRDWSRRLSIASYALQFRLAADLLAAGVSLLLEGNFRPDEQARHFAALTADGRIPVAQVLCSARSDVLVQRFADRVAAGGRHPGHVDAASFEEIAAELCRGDFRPLPLPGPLFEWDSTTPDGQGLERLIATLAEWSRTGAAQRLSTSSTSV